MGVLCSSEEGLSRCEGGQGGGFGTRDELGKILRNHNSSHVVDRVVADRYREHFPGNVANRSVPTP